MRWTVLTVVAVATAGPAITAAPAAAAAPSTVQVSVSGSGGQSDDESILGGEWQGLRPATSADGRYVAFTSYADDLVPGDTNGAEDAFVRDTVNGTTTRVNVSTSGAQDNSKLGSGAASISANGRYVAFLSGATDLAPDIPSGLVNVFVHDLRTGTTVDASVNSDGQPADASSFDPVISASGRYVAFSTNSSNFEDAIGTLGAAQVYVRDRSEGTTSIASVSDSGVPADRSVTASTLATGISADGRVVAFSTEANNLVPADTNYADDVFVHDMATGATQRVSVSSTGAQAASDSVGGSLSSDGTKIVFDSDASNLVPRDHIATYDVFFRDLTTGRTRLVSRSSGDKQGNNASSSGMLSADGRHVVFRSFATNLVPGDTNGAMDVFVRDLGRGRTQRVDVTRAGAQAPLGSSGDDVAISAHGRRAAFGSGSALVADDTNSYEDVYEHDRG